MKLQDHDRARLAADLEKRFAESGINYSELSKLSGVHASQVHRICSGKFRTLSHSVVQICKILGVAEPSAAHGEDVPDPDQARIERTAIALWDRTHEDADRIVGLLRQLSELRRS